MKQSQGNPAVSRMKPDSSVFPEFTKPPRPIRPCTCITSSFHPPSSRPCEFFNHCYLTKESYVYNLPSPERWALPSCDSWQFLDSFLAAIATMSSHGYEHATLLQGEWETATFGTFVTHRVENLKEYGLLESKVGENVERLHTRIESRRGLMYIGNSNTVANSTLYLHTVSERLSWLIQRVTGLEVSSVCFR